MVTILKSDEKNDRQTVQLSLDINSYSSDITLKLAHFGKTYVNLAKLAESLQREEDGRLIEPERFALTAEEMDALVEAWTAFKSQIEAKERACAERIAAQLKEAEALSASVKTDMPELDIKITEGSAGRFVVEAPRFSFYGFVYSDEDGESDLVDAVKRAIARIEHNIARLERLTVSNPDYVTEREQAQITAWRAVHPAAEEQTEQGAEAEEASEHDSLVL